MINPNLIECRLEVEGEVMIFPYNIDELDKLHSETTIRHTVIGFGGVSQPGPYMPAEFPLSGHFWQQWIDTHPGGTYTTVREYHDFLERWKQKQANGQCNYGRFIVTELNFNYLVQHENLNFRILPGAESDMEFSMNLVEYRAHGAKELIVEPTTGAAYVAETPPQRPDERPVKSSIWEVEQGNTLWGITVAHGIPGYRFWEIFDIPQNREIIGNDPNRLQIGQRLIIPESFLQR